MTQTTPQSNQIVQTDAEVELGLAAGSTLQVMNDAISQSLRTPLRLYANNPATAVLNIAASSVQAGNGSGKSVAPFIGVTPAFVASTINFQTAATTGGTINITFPSTTIGNYIRCASTLLSTGAINGTFSTQQASLGALADPATLYTAGGLPIGWVDLQATASTAFKTANSSTSVIENNPGGGSTTAVNNVLGFTIDHYKRTNKTAIGNGATSVTVTFSAPVPDLNYVPVCTFLNTTDSSPQFQPFDITAQTTGGFTVTWNAPTDSVNYVMTSNVFGLT